MEKQLVIFMDSGDTIMNQATEIRNRQGIVVSAGCLPGAEETVRELARRGYPLCLVADGEAQSFCNVLIQHDLYNCFCSLIISENIKAEKPSPRMFKAAMGAMDLDVHDKHRIIMVGNNLARDIYGANRMGIRSVHINWSPRYPKTPANTLEKPTYTISELPELLELADRLEAELAVSDRQKRDLTRT